MPRKTKAEREAALATYRAERVAAYPARLMAVLEEATTVNNYELTVDNRMFVLRDRNEPRYTVVSLTASYTENSDNALDMLEYELQAYAEKRAEEARRMTVRAAALAKLTCEEREELGL